MDHKSNLCCVEYPGIVVDDEKMFRTLGGLNAVSMVFTEGNRRLECKFRPEDRHCKGTSGEKNKANGVLLKIRTKKSKVGKGVVVVKSSVVGKVKECVTFKNLCDFQYLPMQENEDGNLVDIHDDIVPTDITATTWLDEPAPEFLPPPVFTKMDSTQPYLHWREPEEDGENAIGRTRERRSNYVKFVSAEKDEVPTMPNEKVLHYLQFKFIKEEQVHKIKELFEDRPIWTRNALMCVTKYGDSQLKYLLSIVAYHFTSGPYRVTWVRFGYDPRKDPASCRYQTLDYRVKGYVEKLLEKEFKLMTLADRRILKSKMTTGNEQDDNEFDPYHESQYLFKDGYVPHMKQLLYQYCDIHLPEVDEMFNSLKLDELQYDPKNGWLPEDFGDRTRALISDHIMAHVDIVNLSEGDEELKSSSDNDVQYVEVEEFCPLISSDSDD